MNKSLADRMTFPSSTKDGQSTSWADDTDDQPEQPSQTDGASEMQMGSSLLEPEFNVDVKLNDLQADPNNPLYSVKNFADLNLSV